MDQQQRDFAASIDAALGSADVPATVRAWVGGDTKPGRAVWSRLAELGVTAWRCRNVSTGSARPVDLVVAVERLGRWCVPGPVVESLAVAPILLADDDRSAALFLGRADRHGRDATRRPRAVDGDGADLVLLATDAGVSEASAGVQHKSVDPARRLFDVSPSGSPRRRARV